MHLLQNPGEIVREILEIANIATNFNISNIANFKALHTLQICNNKLKFQFAMFAMSYPRILQYRVDIKIDIPDSDAER